MKKAAALLLAVLVLFSCFAAAPSAHFIPETGEQVYISSSEGSLFDRIYIWFVFSWSEAVREMDLRQDPPAAVKLTKSFVSNLIEFYPMYF